MTARPTDWSPLDCPCDPVIGDPDAVREAARQYSSTAEAIKTAQTSLTNISYQSRGQAVAELQNKARELAGQVGQAYSRCEGASEALNGYAPHLENAQKTSLEALREAEKSKRDLEGVQHQKREVEQSYYQSRSPQERDNLKQRYMRLGGQESSAQSAVNAAKSKLRQAIEERDSAAQAASEKLNNVSKNSPIKDGLWDKFKGFLRKLAQVAESLKPILDAISICLTIVCIAVAILCPPVGTALLALSLIVSAATMACSTLSNLSKLVDGKMSPGEFLTNLAVDGAFLAMEAVGFKGAKAAAQAGKAAMKEGAQQGLKEGERRLRAVAQSEAAKEAAEQGARGLRKGLIKLNNKTNEIKNIGAKVPKQLTGDMNRLQAMYTDAKKEVGKHVSKEVFKEKKNEFKENLSHTFDSPHTFKKATVK